MMLASYIGDELTGHGFALAGVHTPSVPDTAEALWRLLLEERGQRELVMISSTCAEVLGTRLEHVIEAHPVPPIVVLPDVDDATAAHPVVRAAYEALGIEGTGN